jgi:hypothetical protein
MKLTVFAAALTLAVSAHAQSSSQEVPGNVATSPAGQSASTAATSTGVRAAATGTMLVVTPREEISSKHVEKGQEVAFNSVNDIVENGIVVIPRGTPVKGTVTWKTGRAIGGKSGKFEVTFNSILLNGKSYMLTGKHRQEGRGNTVGALLGSMFISGRSAVMVPGQLVNVFTAQPITY